MNFKKIFTATKKVAILATTIGAGIIVNEAIKKVIPVNASVIKKVLITAGGLGISELVSARVNHTAESFFKGFEAGACEAWNVMKSILTSENEKRNLSENSDSDAAPIHIVF